MTQNKPRVFITGASGLLGRAVYKTFQNNSWTVYGVAFSRPGENLVKLDLTDEEAVNKAIKDFHPDIIIHCAAQCFLAFVVKYPDEAKKVTVGSTLNIVKATGNNNNVPVLYIGSDYVFDGTSPPYKINDKKNPLSIYAQHKMEAEEIVLRNKNNLVLRIPILYGPVQELYESAITIMLKSLLTPEIPAKISNTEWKNPAHVNDIAHVCFNLANGVIQGKNLNGVFHWCGDEKMTKYEMILKIAEIFNLPSSHITADNDPGAEIFRPRDPELDKSEILNLGYGQHTPFEEGIKEVLKDWVKK